MLSTYTRYAYACGVLVALYFDFVDEESGNGNVASKKQKQKQNKTKQNKTKQNVTIHTILFQFSIYLMNYKTFYLFLFITLDWKHGIVRLTRTCWCKIQQFQPNY